MMTIMAEPRFDAEGEPSLAKILILDPYISERSRWSSKTWYLDGENGGQTSTHFAIHWTVKASPELLNSAKMLAARLFLLRDVNGDPQLKHTTASTFSAGMRHLLRFMSNYAYSSFAQLDEDAFGLFNDNLSRKLSDPAWYVEEFAASDDDADPAEGGDADHPVPEDLELDLGGFDDISAIDEAPMDEGAGGAGKAPQGEDDEFTRIAAYYRLRTWRFLQEHADGMERAGVPSIRFNPFATRSIKELTHRASQIASDLIPPLPDRVALRIMATAQKLIGIPADDVFRLQDDYIACHARLDRQPPTPERQRIRRMMEAFEFSSVDGVAWHAPIELPPDQSGGGDLLRKLLTRIRDAAVLVIFCGTGVRISEMCSLTADPTRKTAALPLFGPDDPVSGPPALPHCVSVEISKTGLNEHFFMRGRLFKNERVPRDETWLIGSRPRGDDVEPPVLRAIRVLERLYAPWRDLSDSVAVRSDLILGFKGHGMPRSTRAVVPIAAGTLRLSLKAFIRDECGLEKLADAARTEKGLQPYVQSRGGCIRPHQWRKTFALYMMKVDDRMVPALAHHFKHMSIAVTENSYMPKDPSMMAAQDSVHMQETARFFYEQVHGAGGSFGRLDDILAEHREEWEKLVADLPFEEALPEIQRFCLERDIRIFHAEHGRCLIGANPDKARCHDVAGTGSWRNARPNHMTRTPSLCAGCSNFSVSGDHAGFWRKRYIRNETSWRESDRSVQFRVIQKRAQQAAQVLSAIGVALPIILAEAPSDRARRKAGRSGTSQTSKKAIGE